MSNATIELLKAQNQREFDRLEEVYSQQDQIIAEVSLEYRKKKVAEATAARDKSIRRLEQHRDMQNLKNVENMIRSTSSFT
jgi:predicted deacetylase